MESYSLMSIVSRGGILMVPIALCSLVVVAVAIERYLAYRRLTINIPKFMMTIRRPLMHGDPLSAINDCTRVGGPVASVVRAGLEKAKFGRARAKEAMETAGNTETYLLEKNLGVLATLAGITPLIGFLGTVTGMIKAFMKIQQLSGNVNADVLAGGIWEAMITTAAGLAVGIPAMILYNYFVHRVRAFVFQMESTAEDVLDLIGRAGDVTAPEPSPDTPVDSPEPPAGNSFELPERNLYAGESLDSFDPADEHFDGGIGA